MTLVNGVLTKPIYVDSAGGEVGKCIGESSGDWRTLCRSNKINPLSKYKPIENPNARGELTDAQRKEWNWGYYIAEESIGLSAFVSYVNSGILPSAWQNPDSNNYRDMGCGWYYRKPETYSRILDFDKYNHYAPALFSEVAAPSKVTSDTSYMYIDLFKGSFWLNDFRVFESNNAHLGVCIIKEGSSTSRFKSILSADSSNSYGKIEFDKNEINAVFVEGAGKYRVYVVATMDNAQNLVSGNEGYFQGNSPGITIWPLPVAMTTIEYTPASSGTSDNIVNFHIDNMDSTSNELSWSLRAYNTTSTAKEVQFVWFHISAVDDFGMTWEMSAPELLQAGAFGINVPANDTVDVGEFTERYEAYREGGLATPWTVTLSIYHSNDAAGTDRRGAGTAQFVYEG